MKGMVLILGGFLLFLIGLVLGSLLPEGTTGSLVLTPDACASVRVAGGTTMSRDGVCIANGQYRRRYTGWTDLRMGPELTVTLPPQSVLLASDDGRIPEPEWSPKQRRILMAIVISVFLGLVCIGLGIRRVSTLEYEKS